MSGLTPSPIASRSTSPVPSFTPSHSHSQSQDHHQDEGPLLASMHRPSSSVSDNPFRGGGDRDSIAPLLREDRVGQSSSGAGASRGVGHGTGTGLQGRYISKVNSPGMDRSFGHPHTHRRVSRDLEWKSLDPRVKRKLIIGYATEWALSITLGILFELLNFVPGYKREFSLTDTSIQHTFAVHERVPVWLLFTIAFGAPMIFMPIANFFHTKSWWDLHNSYLGLIMGLSMTASFTEIVKVTVGRPRPDLIDRCQPLPGSVDHPVFGLSNVSICTQTDAHILKDGFKSFFSGHSSFSFAGLGFLSYYLAGKFHLFDRRGHSGRAWLALAPLIVAALIAISRTMDNRHHWQDVTVGSIVGLTLSFFSYRQFYPKLSHPESHMPYAPRSTDPDMDMDMDIAHPHPAVPTLNTPTYNPGYGYGQGSGQGYGHTRTASAPVGRYSDLESGRSMEMQRTSPPGDDQNLLHP